MSWSAGHPVEWLVMVMKKLLNPQKHTWLIIPCKMVRSVFWLKFHLECGICHAWGDYNVKHGFAWLPKSCLHVIRCNSMVWTRKKQKFRSIPGGFTGHNPWLVTCNISLWQIPRFLVICFPMWHETYRPWTNDNMGHIHSWLRQVPEEFGEAGCGGSWGI